MPTVTRSALVEFPAEQMFDLVNDIEQYPTFITNCKSARVISETPSELIGELCLAKAGIRHCFTTRNILKRPESIKLELVEGDFSRFHGCWEFVALSDHACRFGVDMHFEFNNFLLSYAAEKLLANSLTDLVDAIVARAHELYGET